MRTGEMKPVPVWVHFGLSDRSENTGVGLKFSCKQNFQNFFESCECNCRSDIAPLGASLIVWSFVC